MYPNVVQRYLLLAFSIIFHRAFFHLWHVEGLNTKIGQFVQHLRTLKVSFHYLHFTFCFMNSELWKCKHFQMKFSLQFSARDTILTAVQVSDFAHGPSVLMYIDIMFIFFGGISETIPCLARTLSCTPLIQCRHGDQSKSDPFTSVYLKKKWDKNLLTICPTENI